MKWVVRFGLCALASATLGCAAGRAECVVHGGQAWHGYASEHFQVQTNASVEVADSTLANLERARISMERLWSRSKVTGRVEVVLFDHRRQYDEFAPPGTGGYFSPGARPRIVLPVGDSWSSEESGQTLMHELAHFFGSRVLQRLPVWLSEGLAEYLSTLTMKSNSDWVEMGRIRAADLEWVREHGLVPLSLLAKWRTGDGVPPELNHHRYVTAGFWVHFLVNQHEKEFHAWLKALQDGFAPGEAWTATFGAQTFEGLEPEAKAFLFIGSHKVVRRLVRARPNQLGAGTTLSPAEVHLLRASLARYSEEDQKGDRKARFVQDVQAALALDSTSVAAQLALASVEPLAEQRLVRLRAITQSAPNHAPAWLALHRELRQQNHSREERGEALKAALAANPDDADANNELARFSLRADPRKALELAQRALTLAPDQPNLFDTVAAAQAATGDCASAIDSQERALALLPESSSPRQRQAYAKRLEVWKSGCKDAAGATSD